MEDTSAPWAPELRGRTAIVTGAGRLRSIGRPIALELARQGANVVLTGTGRDSSRYPAEEKAIAWRDVYSVADEIVKAGGKALPLICDIGDPASIESLIEQTIHQFGGLDILINNAGAARGGDRAPVVDLPVEEWTRVLNINLNGTFLTARAAAREMIKRGQGGCILNISSVTSRLAGASTAAYAVSKAGINTLSRVMAVELAKDGIRVNAVLPGVIDTSRMDDFSKSEGWSDIVKSFVPLGTAGDGSEIAHMCVFLCSDKGKWITGQDIAVDGGSSWH